MARHTPTCCSTIRSAHIDMLLLMCRCTAAVLCVYDVHHVSLCYFRILCMIYIICMMCLMWYDLYDVRVTFAFRGGAGRGWTMRDFRGRGRSKRNRRRQSACLGCDGCVCRPSHHLGACPQCEFLAPWQHTPLKPYAHYAYSPLGTHTLLRHLYVTCHMRVPFEYVCY